MLMRRSCPPRAGAGFGAGCRTLSAKTEADDGKGRGGICAECRRTAVDCRCGVETLRKDMRIFVIISFVGMGVVYVGTIGKERVRIGRNLSEPYDLAFIRCMCSSEFVVAFLSSNVCMRKTRQIWARLSLGIRTYSTTNSEECLAGDASFSVASVSTRGN